MNVPIIALAALAYLFGLFGFVMSRKVEGARTTPIDAFLWPLLLFFCLGAWTAIQLKQSVNRSLFAQRAPR